ncbi:sugar ABC transporter permease [Aeromicrobium terrae]|uniref:Xylose transport system permease protein XylH n=1 Tax=Aeromicrobium terrae TaxID=2498846 RepID=A0A5C8NLJ7_9ACTN|nr:inner-membrane translocator [Aeromicrobium terrae]TXL61353.1 inner-membrane translocator [Aeromicrobium terrae]
MSTQIGRTDGAPAWSRLAGIFEDRLSNIPVLMVLGAIWLFFYTRNEAFLSSQNITNLILQIATTAMLALGIVFVLLVGEIDLSSAILSGVCATVVANYAVTSGWNIYLALAAGIALGMIAMVIQAVIVVFGVPSLIVTLGGMVVFQGLLLVVLPPEFTVSVGGTDYAEIASADVPTTVAYLVAGVVWVGYTISRWIHARGSSNDRIWAGVLSLVIGVAVFGGVTVLSRADGLPLPVVILGAMLIVAAYVTTRTRYGIHLYAVGGDRDAARRAGIPVSRMIIYSFAILGFCAAIAGVVDAARLLSVSNSSGGGPLMLNAIAAAVVGGTSLFGGRGSVWSALLGALVIGSISNGVQLLGYSPEVQNFATGGVLVVAVAMDVVITRGSLWPRRA